MTSPQKENGYTPIANELVEQLYKLPLNGTQFRIIFAVFRYTYGFNRKEHELSETFIASALSTHKRQIQRELKALIDIRVLTIAKQATFKSSKVVTFNKHYDQWLISRQVSNSSPGDKNDTTKENMIEIVSSSNINAFKDLSMTNMTQVTNQTPGDGLPAQENNNTNTIINNSIVDNNLNSHQATNQTPLQQPVVKKFIQPTIEEVKAYCLERKKGVNPDKWYNHYTANGWMVGKTKMKDWKAAVRTWEPEDKPKEQSKYVDQSNYFKGGQ
jgi:phage replication O-like protein O